MSDPDETPESLVDALDVLDDLRDRPVTDAPRHGDARSGEVYVASAEIVTALKVAVLTGRPLLLGGPPGCGKSSLASYVARNLSVAYYEFVTTDDARAADLVWRMDAVRRLGDAQAGRLGNGMGRGAITPYIEPGPLWWAFDPRLAARRGLDDAAAAGSSVEPAQPPRHLVDHEMRRPGSVLLIDEIDKADSTFANGLLVPLGSRRAFVPGIDRTVEPAPDVPDWSPLTIITTNNERDLPEAFLRRCIVLRLPGPDAEALIEITTRHFRDLSPELRAVVVELADQVAGSSGEDRPISTAEFLDLVKVVRHFCATGRLDKETMEIVKRVTLDKKEIYGPRDRMWS